MPRLLPRNLGLGSEHPLLWVRILKYSPHPEWIGTSSVVSSNILVHNGTLLAYVRQASKLITLGLEGRLNHCEGGPGQEKPYLHHRVDHQEGRPSLVRSDPLSRFARKTAKFFQRNVVQRGPRGGGVTSYCSVLCGLA
ncbi:hypothetical protein M0802_016016 [Mischocyttarus mexicanus]|nr:hypothetical protein M0802_016016 [Mischocyttarus mexicanus]